MATVRINGEEYTYRFGFGAMMQYEKLTGERLTKEALVAGSVTQAVSMHHACLKAGDENYRMGLAELANHMDSVDVRCQLDNALNAELIHWNEQNAAANQEGEEVGKKKQPKKR